MFYYFTRSLACERLRMGLSQSYRIFGGSRRIRSDYILDLLNRSRRGAQNILTDVPSDLKTPAELAEALAGSGITERNIRAWMKREKNPPPFFRVNKQFRLFRLSAVLDWLDAQSCPRRYIFGRLVYERRRESGTIPGTQY